MWQSKALLSALSLWSCEAAGSPTAQEPLISASTKHNLVLKDDLIAWHKNLTQIDSVTYNEQEAGAWLVSSLEQQGYTVEKQYVDKEADRFNVYAYPGKQRDGRLTLSGHYDTVPPFYPYTHNGTTISGRGSVDDKASVAAQLVAVNSLVSTSKLDPDDVALLFVVGEEIGGDGMRKANDLELKPEIIVFGEPTEGKLVSGHKGNLRLQIWAKGKSAHSGYPWLGRSANEVLTKSLAALMELGPNLPRSDKYGITTINLGRIEGGVASNVVAESASADIIIRIAAGSPEVIKDEIMKALHFALDSFLSDDVTFDDIVEIGFGTSGYGPIDIDHDVPDFDVITVNYGTDIPWLKETVEGQKRYLYGPGSIMVAHSDHEALTEEELLSSVAGYEKIILHAMQQQHREL